MGVRAAVAVDLAAAVVDDLVVYVELLVVAVVVDVWGVAGELEMVDDLVVGVQVVGVDDLVVVGELAVPLQVDQAVVDE